MRGRRPRRREGAGRWYASAAARARPARDGARLRPRRPGAVGSAAIADRFTWRLLGSRPSRPACLGTGLSATRWCDAILLSTNSYLTAWFTRVPTVVVGCATWSRSIPISRRGCGRACIERATLPLAIRRAAALTAISQSHRARAGSSGFPRRLPQDPRDASRGEPPVQRPPARDAAGGGRGRPWHRSSLHPRRRDARAAQEPRSPDGGVSRACRRNLRDAHRLVLVGAAGWSHRRDPGGCGAACVIGAPPRSCPGGGPAGALPGGVRYSPTPPCDEGFGLPVLEAMAAGDAGVDLASLVACPRWAAMRSSTATRCRSSRSAAG